MSIIYTNDIVSELKKEFGKNISKINYDNLKLLCQTVIVVPKKSLEKTFDYIDVNMIMNFNKKMIVYLPDYEIVAYKKPDQIFVIYTTLNLENKELIEKAFHKYKEDIQYTIQYLQDHGKSTNIDLYSYVKK
jgi:GTP:adenosylcobinamide-phosphate guanylyltransferase